MERYKVAATRAHIATKFDITRFDSEFNTPGGNGDFVVTSGEFPNVEEDFDNLGGVTAAGVEDDNDGAVVLVGGSDNYNGRENISNGRLSSEGDTDNYCYIYDYTSGTAYELVEGHENTGFRCNGELVDDDNRDWSVECLRTETFQDCSVPSDVEASNTSTSTTTEDDPDTEEDESVTTEDTQALSNQGTRLRPLLSCERSPSDARCEYVPGIELPIVDDIPAGGRPVCQDGGVPVCIPQNTTAPLALCTSDRISELTVLIQAIRAGDIQAESEEYPETEEELLTELNGLVPGDVTDSAVFDQLYTECTAPATLANNLDSRIDSSLQCTSPFIYGLVNRIQDIRNGVVVPGSDDEQQTEEELLADLNARVPGRDVTDPAVFNALVAEQQLPVDPLSFECTQQAGNSYFVVPEVIAEYGLVTPSCGAAPPNQPDVTEDELFTEASGLVNICTESIHLAPFPFTDDINQDTHIENTGNAFVTGDGIFSRAEERFWGTNPENGNTMGEGITDEEFILGKGHTEFTWKYEEGDEIGVVVEGRGISSTEHNNQNPFVSFAFMKYGCNPKDRGSYQELVRNKWIEFDTAAMHRDDLNVCLYENFAVPGNVEENNNLTVEIDAPEGTVVNNQDFIFEFGATVSNEDASLTEGEITERSVYDWKIFYAPGEEDPGRQGIQWQRFLDYNMSQNNPELFAARMEMLDLTELKSVGLSNLEFKANFDTDDPDTTADEGFSEGLLRVTVEVNAPTQEAGVTVYGRAESIIPLVSQERPQLYMHRLRIDGSTTTPITTIVRSDLDRICDSIGDRDSEPGVDIDDRDDLNAEDIACRIFRNEILAFEIPTESDIAPEHVLWEVNGERISCDTTLAPTLCQQKPPMVLLPAIQRDGVIQTVTASSSNPGDGLDANETFSRSFVVTPPKIVFEATADGGLTPQELGAFIPVTGDENAATTVEESNTVFVRDANVFSIKAKIDPSVLEDYASTATDAVAAVDDERVNVTWEWIDRPGEQGVSNLIEAVTVPEELTDKPVTVKARATFSTPQPIRELLLNKFGVGQYDTSPLTTEAEATVHEPGFSPIAYMNDEQYRTYVQGNAEKNKTFTATVFGNTASYLLFVLKISLTIGIILFLSSFAMGGVNPANTRRRL